MSITYLVVLWACVGIFTAFLAIYRHFIVTAHEENILRLAPGEEIEMARQRVIAHRVGAIDRWGKTLTVFTIVAGLAIAATYGYKAWVDPSAVPNNFYMRTTADR